MRSCLVLTLLAALAAGVPAEALTLYVPVKIDSPQMAPYIRVVKALVAHLGYEAKFIDGLPTARARKDLIDGKIDGVVGMSDITAAEIGDSIAPMTVALFESRIEVYSRVPFHYAGLESLAGHSVGVRRIDAPAAILAKTPGVELFATNDEVSAVRMFFVGRTDLLILNQIIFQSGVDQLAKGELRPYFVSETPFLRPRNLLVLSGRFKDKIAQFDQNLRQLKSSGEFDKLVATVGR